MDDHAVDPEHRPSDLRDLGRSFLVAFSLRRPWTRHVMRLRLRWYGIIGGTAAVMVGTEPGMEHPLSDTALAACGIAVALVAAAWHPRGAPPWWRSPRDDPDW